MIPSSPTAPFQKDIYTFYDRDISLITVTNHFSLYAVPQNSRQTARERTDAHETQSTPTEREHATCVRCRYRNYCLPQFSFIPFFIQACYTHCANCFQYLIRKSCEALPPRRCPEATNSLPPTHISAAVFARNQFLSTKLKNSNSIPTDIMQLQ